MWRIGPGVQASYCAGVVAMSPFGTALAVLGQVSVVDSDVTGMQLPMLEAAVFLQVTESLEMWSRDYSTVYSDEYSV